MFVIKCDVHPWMQSYMGVFAQPVLRGDRRGRQVHDRRTCPPGTYEIEAWHEKLGTQKATVTVGATDTKTIDFKFAPPAAK